MTTPPIIRIGVLVFKNGRILFGKKSGAWHLPSGDLSIRDKSLDAAAGRILQFNASIDIKNIQFLSYISARAHRRFRHTLLFTAICVSPKINRNSRSEYEHFDWFDPNLLPHPFEPEYKSIFNKDVRGKIRKAARASK